MSDIATRVERTGFYAGQNRWVAIAVKVIVVALVMTVAINVYLIVWGTQIWSNLPGACEKVWRNEMRCLPKCRGKEKP